MTYNMPTKQSSFERGDSGLGKIRFSTDGKKVQVVLKVKTGKDTFEERKHILDVSACPDNIEQARNAKEWFISMNSDNTELFSFRPAQGHFMARTKEFASGNNEEPAPKTKDVRFVKNGKTQEYSYEYFTVLLEIVSPEEYKGIVVPLVLHYNLGEYVQDGKSIIGFSMGGKYTEQLKEYMLVAGILEDKYQPMDYKDNILPDMQRIALHEDRKFEFTLKEGWILPGSFISEQSVEDDDLPFDVDPEEIEQRLEQVTNGSSSDEFEDDDEIDFEPQEEFVD